MIIDTAREMETNISTAVQFRASANAAKLFAMLGSYLYSNKEACVLHELSANAIDAHRMNGNEHVPFQVMLPTSLDSQLRIRDFGPGMSEENVYRYLTTYGESSKQDNNLDIGGWGIGSKSPASVSDTWKISSHHEGLMSEYLVFVDADGIPSITKIRTVQTDQTGLEVSIPVQSSRIGTWQNLMQSTYAFYPVAPTLVNTKHQIRSEYPEVKHGDSWWFNKINDRSSPTVSVVCSNRKYVCDAAKIAAEFKSEKAAKMINLSLFLQMQIGEVDLSISREQMQYTAKTIASIETALDKVYDDIHAMFKADIDGFTDELDYRVRVLRFMNDRFDTTYYGYNSLGFMPTFIDGAFGIYHADDLVKYNFGWAATEEELDIRVTNGQKFRSINGSFNCWRDYAIVRKSQYASGKYHHDVSIRIDFLPRIKFYVADVADAYARVHEKFNTLSEKYAVVFRSADNLPQMIKSRVVFASTLPKKARAPRAKSCIVKSDTDLYHLEGARWVRRPTDFLDGKKLVYVLVDSFASASQYVDYPIINTLIKDWDFNVIAVKNVDDVPAGVNHYLDQFESNVNAMALKIKAGDEVLRLQAEAILNSPDWLTSNLVDFNVQINPNTLFEKFRVKHTDALYFYKNRCGSRDTPFIRLYDRLSAMLLQVRPDAILTGVDLTPVEVIKNDLTDLKNAYNMLTYLRTDTARDHGLRKAVTQFLDLSGV